jgi:NAD(P)-dependent dehydrogenase (short-subunit alcohol dehydrogenase family)
MVTPMVRTLGKNAGRSDEEQMFNRSTNLLGMLGDAWDIGWAAVFLASDEARWITGITVPVDGGFLISSPEVTGVADAQLREFTPTPLVR